MFTNFITTISQTSELVFWASALFGTTLFALRLLMFMLGIGDDNDTTEHDHASVDGDDVDHPTTGSFKLLTMHSISGFFMMFGWVGLGCSQQLGYPAVAAGLMALLAGIVVMLLTALIFRWAQVLVSSGTRFDIKKTVGLPGTVYQEIPVNGQGKIQVVVDGITRELLAQSANGAALASFTHVTITQAVDHEVVLVTSK